MTKMFEFMRKWGWIVLTLLPVVGYLFGKRQGASAPQAETRKEIRANNRAAAGEAARVQADTAAATAAVEANHAADVASGNISAAVTRRRKRNP